MSNKRLIFDVPEELHARLKSEAAQLGIPLGSHCASILEGGGQSPSVLELDQTTISAMPLGVLRQMCQDLADKKPQDWSQAIVRIQSEIRRRYRV
jgi:hypothetical protein